MNAVQALVAGVGDVQGSVPIRAEALGAIEVSAFCRAAIAFETGYAVTGREGNAAVAQIQAADLVSLDLGETRPNLLL